MTPDSTDDWPVWRRRLHTVIFEADTPGGKLFDVLLLIVIGLSVLAAMLDSVASISTVHHDALLAAEWVFTLLFTLEYVLRLLCVRRKLGYALSFYGVIDLLAIVPTYLTLLAVGWHGGVILRALRLLRVFRIFKLAQFLTEAASLRAALAASRAKITVFLAVVLIIICIVGSAMYLIEGPEHGFTSIPQGIYWAVVTVTTVGYGDVSPATPLGKAVAVLVMLVGYSILIIPGGIISAEWASARSRSIGTQACPDCSREGHDTDAAHCKFCGGRL
ncbi:MAG: ion transporter [Planctomycetota bacterium]|jgi:voltage-gated potassium channel